MREQAQSELLATIRDAFRKQEVTGDFVFQLRTYSRLGWSQGLEASAPCYAEGIIEGLTNQEVRELYNEEQRCFLAFATGWLFGKGEAGSLSGEDFQVLSEKLLNLVEIIHIPPDLELKGQRCYTAKTIAQFLGVSEEEATEKILEHFPEAIFRSIQSGGNC